MADEVKLTYISGLSGLTANVFSGDGNTQRNDGNAVAMSDSGHLGLYLGTATDIKVGDVIVFYLNNIYLTGLTYQIVDVLVIEAAAGSVLDLGMCNLSLNLLGAQEVDAGSPSERNYLLCEDLYPEARNEILACHPWNFAIKRALAIQTTDPIFGPDNAFTKPSDCLRVLTVAQDPAAIFRAEGDSIITDEGETPAGWGTDTDFLVGHVVTNNDVTYTCTAAHTSATADEPGVGGNWANYWDSEGGDYQYLELEYIYLATDATSYPPFLRRCVVLNLAIKLASAIKQNETVALNLQAMLYGSSKVNGYLSQARSYDAQEAGGTVIKTQTWLDSRK